MVLTVWQKKGENRMKNKIYNTAAVLAGAALLWLGGWSGLWIINGIMKLLHI